jgi:hypothetical protein
MDSAGAPGVLMAPALVMACLPGPGVESGTNGKSRLAGGHGGGADEEPTDRKGDKYQAAQSRFSDHRSTFRSWSQRPKLATIELAVAAFPRSGSPSSSSVVRRRDQWVYGVLLFTPCV